MVCIFANNVISVNIGHMLRLLWFVYIFAESKVIWYDVCVEVRVVREIAAFIFGQFSSFISCIAFVMTLFCVPFASFSQRREKAESGGFASLMVSVLFRARTRYEKASRIIDPGHGRLESVGASPNMPPSRILSCVVVLFLTHWLQSRDLCDGWSA